MNPILAMLLIQVLVLVGLLVPGNSALSAAVSEQRAPVTPLGKAPESTGGAAVARRITANQYQRIITDVFGTTVAIDGRFEPDVRAGPVGGLAAVGAARVSVSATGFEQYDGTARAIAATVVDENNRTLLIPCKPSSLTAPDDACARVFLSTAGRYLYRRPLSARELDSSVALAAQATRTLNSFYTGLEISLAALLESLPFLFRDETAEPDPEHPGRYRLDAYSKASRLSFLLWDTAPDAQLLFAAEKGELDTQAGLQRQVDRLLASPRLADGIRAFFTDMLHLDELSLISKDSTIYPKYTAEVAREAQEQTLRTITDHLLVQRGDYRELFTTRSTVLTPLLGSVYGVPVRTDAVMDEWDIWQPYQYPPGDPRVGLLTQVSFVALHSHPGRTSPTLRGKALREILLCQKVPDPPANVDFTKFEQTAASYNTARERLSAHAGEPMCAGCHKITDPMGFALENFDSAGGYRTHENGSRIDTSGTFNGKKFSGVAELSHALQEYQGAASCFVDKFYAYATGRTPASGEAEWINYLKQSFAGLGYRVPDLLRLTATSEAFYRVAPPERRAEADSAASAQPTQPVDEVVP